MNYKLFNTKFKNENAIISLINKYFWKSKIGPLISILLPLVFMIVYKIASKSDSSFFSSALGVYLSFSTLPLLLITLPQLIVEFKTSIILRKISVSSITKVKFCIILLIYYLIVSIISNLIIIAIFAAFLNKDANHYFSNINWAQLFYALLNIYMISLTTGLMLGVLINKNVIVQLTGLSVMLISVLFAGQFIPMTVIANSDALRYISLFSPITYSLGLSNNVLMITDVSSLNQIPINPNLIPLRNELLNQCLNNNIFDIKHSLMFFDYTLNDKLQLIPQRNIVIYECWQKILNLIMPYIFSILFMFISIKKFNWTSR